MQPLVFINHIVVSPPEKRNGGRKRKRKKESLSFSILFYVTSWVKYLRKWTILKQQITHSWLVGFFPPSLPSSPPSCVPFFAVSMKVGEEQRDLEESQDNQIEIAFGSEMQELSLLIQALNCSVN